MGTYPIFESDFDCLTEKSMFANKTVAELKTECKSRGIPVTGKKQELIDRLMAAENDKSMEDDLLDEPDVSLGEEVGQETAEETVTEPASENAADETEEQRHQLLPSPMTSMKWKRKSSKGPRSSALKTHPNWPTSRKSHGPSDSVWSMSQYRMVRMAPVRTQRSRKSWIRRRDHAPRDLGSTSTRNGKPNLRGWTLVSMPRS